MKEVTHIIFGAGCAAVVEAQLRPMGQAGLALLLVLWLALAVNRIIDVGHTFKDTRYGHIPVRSWVTHGILTAPAWGALVGAFSVTIPEWALVHVVDLNLAFLAAVLGIVVAYSHLFTDSLTQAGVFYGRKRIALAHWRYDIGAANLSFILLGLVLLFLFALRTSGV